VAYSTTKTEENKIIAARAALDSKTEQVGDMYSLDRKKGKVVFRNYDVVLKQLG